MEHYNDGEPINLGSGEEIRIKDLAELICELTGFRGQLRWDASKPDGQPRRCLNTERALRAFGFRASTRLSDGLRETISWYEQQCAARRAA
jgi:GDP-L-fucose synthase